MSPMIRAKLTLVKESFVRYYFFPMKRIGLASVLFIFLSLLPSLTFGQTSEIVWVPIQTPQLQKEEILWLDSITSIPDASRYLEAIGYMETQAKAGNISAADASSIAVLSRIALSPYEQQFVGLQPLVPGPEVRLQAVEVLSFIGGNYSLSVLDALLEKEEDDSVLAAAYGVYAEIAPPFNLARSAAFTTHLRSSLLSSRKSALTVSILTAIDAMHRRTFSMNDTELFSQILNAAEHGQNMAIRQQAASIARFIAGVE